MPHEEFPETHACIPHRLQFEILTIRAAKPIKLVIGGSDRGYESSL